MLYAGILFLMEGGVSMRSVFFGFISVLSMLFREAFQVGYTSYKHCNAMKITL